MNKRDEERERWFVKTAEDFRPVVDKVLSRAEGASVKVQGEERRRAMVEYLTLHLIGILRVAVKNQMDGYFEDMQTNYKKFF